MGRRIMAEVVVMNKPAIMLILDSIIITAFITRK